MISNILTSVDVLAGLVSMHPGFSGSNFRALDQYQLTVITNNRWITLYTIPWKQQSEPDLDLTPMSGNFGIFTCRRKPH